MDMPGPRRRTRLGGVLGWTAVLVLAIAAGLVIALTIDVARAGSVGTWLARHHLTPLYEAKGILVDVGPRRLYLDCRGEGSPTIVLEAGSGANSATWSAVLGELAAATRTCAYDRAGRGRSDPTGQRTLREAGAELRALLDAAGEPPPYLLVGHSLGGAFARVFASDHRDDVIGVVLVDTFDPDLQEGWIHPLLEGLEADYDSVLDGLRATVTSVDSLDWAASESQLRASDLHGLPVEVLRAPRYEPRLSETRNAEIAHAWEQAYESLSPGMVRLTTAWGAGHDVQIDRPDLVIQAARRLVDAWRAR